MKDRLDIISAVEGLYDTFPFPPDPLIDEAPPGYNWRWSWPVAYSFCTGQKPKKQDIRILDAGCGTGSSTDYLVHLNPQASVVGIDLSGGALGLAKERCIRSGASRVEFHHLSIYDLEKLEGEFDFINCVGVLHHLPDPIQGIQNLALKLAPGGIMHIFVYAELGRWEIRLMQQAIAILQGNKRGNYQDGVKIGRQLFASLPENNRLVKYEQERWSLENQRDECFADMYVHPQEIDYNIDTLFELIEASGLEFLGFSNWEYWDIKRLLGKSPELIEKAIDLNYQKHYRLIEVLDPQISHYEFFLGRPPLQKVDWSHDQFLRTAIPELSPCIQGWPSENIFDGNYRLVNLSRQEYEFLEACDQASGKSQPTVEEILTNISVGLETVRLLQSRLLILLTPSSGYS